jgi:hypothetical protein
LLLLLSVEQASQQEFWIVLLRHYWRVGLLGMGDGMVRNLNGLWNQWH